MGLLALLSLLDGDGRAEESASANPLAAKPPHFPAKAKSVIWCFLDGGPSHIDLFDPKPELTKLAGKPLPSSFKRPVTAMGRTSGTPLLASKRKFKQYGQAGHMGQRLVSGDRLVRRRVGDSQGLLRRRP